MTTHKWWHRQRLLVVVFLCIEFVDEIVDGLSGAAWPLIRDDLALSYTEIGLLFSIPSLVAHVVEPPIGLLGDAWRRYALIALGGLAYATSMFMFAGAGGFWALLAAMTLLYPASGTFVSLSQSSLMDGMEGEQERGMVIWTIAGSIGVAAGPLALAAAISLGYDWRGAFAAVGAVLLGLACALWVVRPREHSHDVDVRPDPRTVLADAWSSVRDWSIVRWLALLAAADLLLEVFVGFLALYLVDEVGASPALAAVGLAIWTVAALVGEAALVVLLKRYDGLTIVRRSAWVVLALFPTFIWMPTVPVKLCVLALIGLFSAGWYSITKAQYFRTMRGRTGTAMALSSVFGPIVGLVPAALGLMAEHVGLGGALWVVMLAPIAMLAAPASSEQDR